MILGVSQTKGPLGIYSSGVFFPEYRGVFFKSSACLYRLVWGFEGYLLCTMSNSIWWRKSFPSFCELWVGLGSIPQWSGFPLWSWRYGPHTSIGSECGAPRIVRITGGRSGRVQEVSEFFLQSHGAQDSFGQLCLPVVFLCYLYFCFLKVKTCRIMWIMLALRKNMYFPKLTVLVVW